MRCGPDPPARRAADFVGGNPHDDVVWVIMGGPGGKERRFILHEDTLAGDAAMRRPAGAPAAITPGHDPVAPARHPAAASGLGGLDHRPDADPKET